jgi:sirohydrochlorin ferrochelatase
MKVYLATEGWYSDYRVLAVFTNRTDAEEVGESVEEFELYESRPVPQIVHVLESMPWNVEPRYWREVVRPWDYRAEWAVTRPRVDVWPHGMRAYGLDEKGVRKAFADRQAQRRGESEGIA